MVMDPQTEVKDFREQVLAIEPESREAILREIEIASKCIEMDVLYTEWWLKVALRFEVVGSDWSGEWYYGTWPSKGLKCVFGDQELQTLRITEALPLGAYFNVAVFEGGGVAEIISRLDKPSSTKARYPK